MSITCVVVFAVFFSIRTKTLLSGANAFKFVTDVPRHEESFDLIKLGYYFAVEAIAPEIGTIKLQVKGLKQLDVPLVDCLQDESLNKKSKDLNLNND